MIGNCPAMKALNKQIQKIAPTDATVLIYGESGTGKERVAKMLHNLSHRSDHPFVVVDCGAIPETLIESKLFGYERGAFTGAHTRKKGQFELADGGTIFLDEIGELPLHLQTRLLRVLETGQIQRLGSEKPIHVNVRVVAATHRHLAKWIAQQHFREDLFYRLNVITLKLPPLQERGTDITHLAEHFLTQLCEKHHRNISGFTSEAHQMLLKHHWSGNVRELKHCIERAVILSENQNITPSDLELVTTPSKSDLNLKDAREALEIEYLKRALHRHKGDVRKAANALGISHAWVYKLLRKYDISILPQ